MTTDSIKAEYRTILWIIGVLFILQITVCLLTDGFCLSFDEAMWHYIGRNWFRNDLTPYAGGVDNKSPLIFAVFGLSDKLFGVNYWFPRVLASVAEAIGVFYIYKIARYISGHRAGVLAVSFYGLSLLWHDTGGKYVAYTETYEVLFIIIAFYHFLTAQNRKCIFISGLLIGVAIAFRVTAVCVMLVLFVSSFRRSRSYVLILGIGALSSILLLTEIAFLLGFNLQSMFINLLFENFNSGSANDHILAWKLHNFSDKFIWSAMPLFYPLVLGYLIIKRKTDLFVWWFIMTFIGICAVGIFDVVHLKEVLPPLSLMSGIFISDLENRLRLPVIAISFAVWLVFLPKSPEPVQNLGRLFVDIPTKVGYCRAPYLIPDEASRKKLGQWVRDQTSPKDMVYVGGFGAQIQVYSERISPTIYFNVTQTPMAKQRFYRDMRQNKPVIILVPMFAQYQETVGKDMRDFVDNLVVKDYQPTGCMFSYAIYKLKSGIAPSAQNVGSKIK